MVFRAKMMSAQGRAYDHDVFAGFDDFRDPQGFGDTRRPLPQSDWRLQLARITGRDIGVRPRCGGPLSTTIIPHGRAPPLLAA